MVIILAGNFGVNDVITMAHGSGGQAGHELMEKILLPAFDNPILREMHDGAKLDLSTNKNSIYYRLICSKTFVFLLAVILVNWLFVVR